MPPSHPKPVIGLLGAPGSGKSEAARVMADEGCAVIDADAIAKAQLEVPEVIDALVARFGQNVLAEAQPQRNPSANRVIDRKELGEIVFADDSQRAWLEALIHPRVHAERERLRERYFANPGVRAIVEDCPLIIESGMRDQCDVLVMIDTSRAVREQRVAETRGWTPAELARREASQAGLDTKLAAADYVLRNEAGFEALAEAVRDVLTRILC